MSSTQRPATRIAPPAVLRRTSPVRATPVRQGGMIAPPAALRAQNANARAAVATQQAAQTATLSPAMGGMIAPPPALAGQLKAQQQAVAQQQSAASPPVAASAQSTADFLVYDDDDEFYDDDVYDDWDDGGMYDDDDGMGGPEQLGFPNLSIARNEPQVNISQLEQIRGHITEIKRYNDWARGRIVPESGGSSVVITGSAIAELSKGDNVILFGNKKRHPTYGDQFDVEISTPDATSMRALTSHLIKNFKGIGAAGANRIIAYHQENDTLGVLRDQLIYSPSLLDFTPITGRRSELINDDDSKQGRINTLFSLQYSALGVRSDVLNRLARSVRQEIDKLSPAQLKERLDAINNPDAANDGSEDDKKPAKDPVVAKPIEAAAPTAQKSDEQHVADLMAEYERQHFLMPQGIVPTSTPQPIAPERTQPTVDSPTSAFAQAAQDMLARVALEPEEPAAPAHDPNHVDQVMAARAIFAHDPYRYIPTTEGYSFVTADKIAREENVSFNSPLRIKALVAYALDVACQSQGHTYIDEAFLRHAITQIDGRVNVDDAIERAVADGLIEKEGERYYPKGLLRKEKELAYNIATRISYPVTPLVGGKLSEQTLEETLDRAEKIVGAKKGIENFKLDDTQRAAVRSILTSDSSLHVIEGGPGRGKTAIVQVLMEALVQLDKKPETAFCAPVGKASKVLNAQIKDYGNASTVHSLLGARGTGYEFAVDRSQPLEVGLLVADEQSMTSLELGYALFDAVKMDSHIILLGDTNQLSPIDSGNVMKSIVAIDGVDKHMLTVPHRNQGQILSLVDTVCEGNWPTSESEVAAVEADGDVVIHNGANSLHPSMIEPFIDRVQAASQQWGGMENVGVICPRRRGNINSPDWNVTYLNEALRERLNPDPHKEKAIIGSNMRINDRVIVTKNIKALSYDDLVSGAAVLSALGEAPDEAESVRVANGDTGYLEKAIVGNVDGARQAVGFVIKLDGGEDRVLIGHDNRQDVGLAYAITVHAAQGSEYAKVFGVVTPGQPGFMHRPLAMTMLSRARESLEVFGPSTSTASIIARTAPVRNCGIYERAVNTIQQFIDAEEEQISEPVLAYATPQG